MTRLVVLGAGKIGHAIATFLLDAGDYAVTVADRDALALKHVPDGAERLALDITDPAALRNALRDSDVVINALPFFLSEPVASAARDTRTAYFDLTEDVAASRAIRKLADGADSLFAPQCGLAPGFVSIAAYDLCKRFERLRRVRLRVGALPLFPTNAFKYNLTWSTAGLINEYCNPCEIIHEGQRREAMPLEGLEQFSLDGETYEAFNTSGGLGTLCDTLDGKTEELSYKTVRYPGHCALMRVLCSDLRLCERRDVFLDVIEQALPATAQDVVLVFVSVSGTRDGHLVQETFTKKVYHGEVGGKPLAAIQITTASSVCAVVDLYREGKLARRGVLRQEDVPLQAFLNNRFGRWYA
jgi:saccharopine dehydrogenase-like NADP-dependent oxidoreductase